MKETWRGVPTHTTQVDSTRYQVDVSAYGRVKTSGPKPVSDRIPSITVEKRGVMVSGEYVPTGEDQRKPVEQIWRDILRPGKEPIAERRFTYAELAQGTLALQGIEQVTRVQGVEQQQRLSRTFHTDGSVSEEVLLVDHAVRTQRWYRASTAGLFVQEEVYDHTGALLCRRGYERPHGERTWRVSITTLAQDGEERTEVKQPCMELPALTGDPTGLPFLDALLLPQTSEPVLDWTDMSS